MFIELVGEFADEVRDGIRDALAERCPDYAWETERRLRRTPIDAVGETDTRFVAVELEWRRADPANNTAKLFYYLSEGDLADYESIAVCQVFTGYYDLQSGGYSSKREVAEFVGRRTSDSFENVTYDAFDLAIDPPKRGGTRPDGWREAVAMLAEELEEVV